MASYFKLQPTGFNPHTAPAGFSTSVGWNSNEAATRTCPLQDSLCHSGLPRPIFPSQGVLSTKIGGTAVSSWPWGPLPQQGCCSAATLVLLIYLIFIYFSAETTAHVHGVLLCLSGPQTSSRGGWVC